MKDYIIYVISNIHYASYILLFLSAFLSGISFFVLAETGYEENELVPECHFFKYIFKLSTIIFVISLILVIFLPDFEVMKVLLG